MLLSERTSIINKIKEVSGLRTVDSFADQLKDQNSSKMFVKRMPAVLVSLPVVRCEKTADYGFFSVTLEYEIYVFVSNLQTHTATINQAEDFIIKVAEKLATLDRFTLKEFRPIIQDFPVIVYAGLISKTTKKEI